MKAKEVSGNLRRIYDASARKHGYESWGEFVRELGLENEQAGEAKAVLDDMESGDLDTIGGRGDV